MYATCLFCHSPLGANESIEHFPVGHRLAFDAAKGRLWVVCAKCERWNLSPIEERWEAIEEAERAYRDTKKRVATDNIGLARLKDGTELVRIGKPMLPEFAAWRYGDQFGKRLRRQWLIGGGGTAAILGVMIGGPAIGIAVGGVGAAANLFNVGNVLYQKFVPRLRVADGDGNLLPISGLDLRKVRISLRDSDENVRVEFPYRHWKWSGLMIGAAFTTGKFGLLSDSHAHLEGETAIRAMSTIFPAINGSGGSAKQVKRAVAAIEQHRNSVTALLREEGRARSTHESWHRFVGGEVHRMDKSYRLALEMTLHEADERRALEGELAELENRWKQAEEIAAIADGLTLPANTEESLENLRQKRTPAE